MHFDDDLHAVLQIGDAVLADPVLLQLGLFVGGVIHEHQGVALLVQIGELLLLQGHALDLVLRAEAFAQLVAGLEVLGLDVGEGAALTRLDVAGLGHDPQALVVLKDHAGLDVVAVDFCHGGSPGLGRSQEGARIRSRSLEEAARLGKAGAPAVSSLLRSQPCVRLDQQLDRPAAQDSTRLDPVR